MTLALQPADPRAMGKRRTRSGRVLVDVCRACSRLVNETS